MMVAIVILIIAYIAFSVYVGYKMGDTSDSFILGFLTFGACLIFTPFIMCLLLDFDRSHHIRF